ncbi:hypothetical protein PAMP_000966 [Pampus punctatissimus]
MEARKSKHEEEIKVMVAMTERDIKGEWKTCEYMFDAWILLFLLLPGVKAFLIHNTHRSLCLEDTEPAGEVLLKKCNLDSESQQWVWVDQSMLMCVASSRCLSAQHREPVRTQPCLDREVNAVGLMWDCDRDRLISRNTSMLLSIDGRRLTLSRGSRHSKWRSLDGGDICQEKLRSKRSSDEIEFFEMGAMTEEEKKYLRWYYRTEDPTIWRFVLLGLAFVCLLVGFLLLGMGAMASKYEPSEKVNFSFPAFVLITHTVGQ